MARMLSDRDSTGKHLELTRRHLRLCKQVKGAEPHAAAIEPAYRELLEKQAATRAKFEAKQEALDNAILRDAELDDGVRTAFEKATQFDRENPAAQVLVKIFPAGGFSEITRVERAQEPNVVEQLAVRFEGLGENHPLYGVAADLRARTEASRAADSAHLEAIRNQKLAEADEEIAQAKLRRQYEINYLEARRTFSRAIAERLFPRISAREELEEPVPTPAT